MNYLSITGFVLFIVSFFITIYVWLNKKNNVVNIIIGFFTIVNSLWGLSLYFATTTENYALSYSWYMLLGNLMLISGPLLINFVLIVSDKNFKLKGLIVSYLAVFFMILVSRLFPSLYLTHLNVIDVMGHEVFFPKGGKLFYLATSVYFIQILYALFLMNYNIKYKVIDISKLKNLRGLNVGLLFGYIPSLFFHFGICYYFFSPAVVLLSLVGLLIGLYYFLHHNIENIDIEWGYITTMLLYFLIFFTVSITLLYLVYENVILSFVLVVLIILIFPIFYKWVKGSIKKEFYKTKYIYLKELSDLSDEVENLNIFSKKEIAKVTVERLGKILDVETVSLFLQDDYGIGYKAVLLNEFEYKKTTIGSISTKEALISLINLNKRYLKKNDLLEYTEIDAYNIMNALRASVIFPIFLSENLYGLLFLGNKKNQSVFLKEDIKTITNIIKNIEKTILKAEIVKQYAEQHKIDSNLNIEFIATVKRLIEQKNIDDLSTNVVNLLIRNLDVDHAALYLYSIADKKYLNMYSRDKKGEKIFPETTFSKTNNFMKMIHHQENFLFIDKIEEMVEKDQNNYGGEIIKDGMEKIKASLIVPVVMDELLGFIALGKKDAPYSSSDIFKLTFVAHALAMTLQNLTYSDEIIKDNNDTRIYNKMYFSNLFEEAIIRAFKTKKEISLVFIQLDKIYAAKDITKIVKSIKQFIRVAAILCRYSETEFALISSETDNNVAMGIAERIRKKLLKINFKVNTGVATIDPKEYDKSHIEMIEIIKDKFVSNAYQALKNSKKVIEDDD